MKTYYQIKGYIADAEIDDFQQGCIGETKTEIYYKFTIKADTIPDLIKTLTMEFCATNDEDFLLDSCDENGRIDLQVVQETAFEIGKISEETIESWKRGETVLWLKRINKMRQWMVDPRIMCRQHLLGEHVEHHMFIGTINRGKNIAGFLENNLLEPLSLASRHNDIVEEMKRRGYNHKSPLPVAIFKDNDPALFVTIDRGRSLADLISRCPECRAGYGAS